MDNSLHDAEEKAKALAMFNSWDQDHSGMLSRAEVTKVLKDKLVYKSTGKHISDEHMIKVFEVLDQDGSGTLNFKEFYDFLVRIRTGKGITIKA